MIKLIAAFLALAVLGSTVFYDMTSTPGTPPQQIQETLKATLQSEATDFAFKTMSGKEGSLSTLPHEEVLVHFWAGWCTTCFAEFPELLEYIENRDGKTALLAIAIDDELKPARDFMARLEAKNDINLKQKDVFWIWDEDKNISLKKFNTTRVPETIIVKNGVMVDKIVGPAQWRLLLP